MFELETRLKSCNSQYFTYLLEVPTAIQRSQGLNDMQTGYPEPDTLIDFIKRYVVVSQNLIVPSLLPDTIIFQSGEMSRHVMSQVCALYVLMHAFWRRSHILTFVSTAPETTMFALIEFSTYKAEQLVRCPFSFDIVLLAFESQFIIDPPCVPARTFLLYDP